MPRESKHKHHHSKEARLSDHNIFIKNTVTVEAPKQVTELHNKDKEDGCTSCFKGLFKALRR